MADQQAGAPQGSQPQGASHQRTAQMEASQTKPARAPYQAAFGTSSGAAVIRDYAGL
jgi:hypothetical protein